MILLWRTLTQQLAGNNKNNNNSKQRQWVGKQTTRPTINKLNKRQSSRRIYTKICKQMTNKWSQTTTTRAAAEQEQTETTVRGRRQQSKVRGVSTPVHTHANTHKRTHTHTARKQLAIWPKRWHNIGVELPLPTWST